MIFSSGLDKAFFTNWKWKFKKNAFNFEDSMFLTLGNHSTPSSWSQMRTILKTKKQTNQSNSWVQRGIQGKINKDSIDCERKKIDNSTNDNSCRFVFEDFTKFGVKVFVCENFPTFFFQFCCKMCFAWIRPNPNQNTNTNTNTNEIQMNKNKQKQTL